MPVTIISSKSDNSKLKPLSRGLIIGSPNTGKTSLLQTITQERVIVYSFPDEKGIKSIPQDQDNIIALTPTYDTLPENASQSEYLQLSLDKYNITLQTIRKILKLEYGEGDVLFLDGLSKFYETVLDITGKGKYLQGRAFENTGDFTTRIYGQAHVLFRNFLSEIYLNSTFQYVISTCWEKLSHEDENASEQEKRDNLKHGRRVWLPALPGQMANLSTGEFDWCIRAGFTHTLHCTMCKAFTKKNLKDKVIEGDHHTLQLRPYEDVQCVAVKGSRNKIIPTFIHQEWEYLKSYI